LFAVHSEIIDVVFIIFSYGVSHQSTLPYTSDIWTA